MKPTVTVLHDGGAFNTLKQAVWTREAVVHGGECSHGADGADCFSCSAETERLVIAVANALGMQFPTDELETLRKEICEAHIWRIVAQNPGIDEEEVRASVYSTRGVERK